MTDLVEDTRRYVLRYFNASPDEYIAIFTAQSNFSGVKHSLVVFAILEQAKSPKA